MRFLSRSLVGLLVVALSLGLLAMAAFVVKSAFDARNADAPQDRPVRERIYTADVMTVTTGRVTPILSAFGEVASRRTLEIRATAAGRIVELSPNFREGGEVTGGELLVRTDPADAEGALALAKAGLSDAEAEAGDAARAVDLAGDDLAAAQRQADLRETALTRQRGLADRSLGTTADLEAAELAASTAAQSVTSRRQALAAAQSRLTTAQSALGRQRIAVDEAERRLAETEIRAPFDGRLSSVTAVPGGLVTANEKLGDLIDPEDLEVSFRIPTAQFMRLVAPDGGVIDAVVEVSLDIFGTEIAATGHLDRVGASVAEGQSGRLLFATLDAANGLKPGDFVSVRVAEPDLTGVALIPAAAVSPADDVLVLGDEDRLQESPVQVLRRQDDAVIIAATDLAGREIVTERSPLLGSGIRIRPMRGDGGAAGPQASALSDANAVSSPAAVPGPSKPRSGDLVTLTPERRADLIARVRSSTDMPAEARARAISQLQDEAVPADMIEQIERRTGG